MRIANQYHGDQQRAMVIREACPQCGSTRFKKNGHTRHGKQNHLCKNCQRQFSAGAENRLVSAERRADIENLLCERISLRGICRAVDVSLTWLLHFMVECFAGSCMA
jgi:insertion element IS1 protein InsB